MAIGPESFVVPPNAQPPMAQATLQQAAFQGNLVGGASVANVGASSPGGDLSNSKFMNDINGLLKLGEFIYAPKLKEMQSEQITHGISRAARGDTMKSIAEEQPWWSKPFGESFVTQGARQFAVATENIRKVQDLHDRMPELAKMSPEEADKIISQTLFTPNENLDVVTQSMVSMEAVKSMPGLMKTHQAEHYRRLQAEATENLVNRNVEIAKRHQQIGMAVMQGKMSVEDAKAEQANLLAGLARPEGMDEAHYAMALETSRAKATQLGLGMFEDLYNSPQAMAGLHPSQRMIYDLSRDKNESSARANALLKNPELMRSYIAAANTIAGLPAEDRLEAAERLNAEFKVMSGGVGGNWFNPMDITMDALSETSKASKAAMTAQLRADYELAIQRAQIHRGDPVKHAEYMEEASQAHSKLWAVNPEVAQSLISDRISAALSAEKFAVEEERQQRSQIIEDEVKAQQKEALKQYSFERATKAFMAVDENGVSMTSVQAVIAILKRGGHDEDEVNESLEKIINSYYDMGVQEDKKRAALMAATGSSQSAQDTMTMNAAISLSPNMSEENALKNLASKQGHGVDFSKRHLSNVLATDAANSSAFNRQPPPDQVVHLAGLGMKPGNEGIRMMLKKQWGEETLEWSEAWNILMSRPNAAIIMNDPSKVNSELQSIIDHRRKFVHEGPKGVGKWSGDEVTISRRVLKENNLPYDEETPVGFTLRNMIISDARELMLNRADLNQEAAMREARDEIMKSYDVSTGYLIMKSPNVESDLVQAYVENGIPLGGFDDKKAKRKLNEAMNIAIAKDLSRSTGSKISVEGSELRRRDGSVYHDLSQMGKAEFKEVLDPADNTRYIVVTMATVNGPVTARVSMEDLRRSFYEASVK